MAMFRGGVAAMGMQDWEKAQEFVSEAIKADPRRGEAWALYADIFFEQGMYEIALPHYEYASKLTPPEDAIISVDRTLYDGGWKILYHIAMCHEFLGHNKLALEILQGILNDEDVELEVEIDRTEWVKMIEYRILALEAKLDGKISNSTEESD